MISKTGLHAIRALVQLALLPEQRFVGAGELATQIDAPQNYLGKLLQSMARSGLVESRKGLGGGFRLARGADSITLLDVLDPIEHLSRWEGCFLGNPVCSDTSACAVHDRWGKLRSDYLGLLSETSIADLVQRVPPPARGGRAARCGASSTSRASRKRKSS